MSAAVQRDEIIASANGEGSDKGTILLWAVVTSTVTRTFNEAENQTSRFSTIVGERLAETPLTIVTLLTPPVCVRRWTTTLGFCANPTRPNQIRMLVDAWIKY